MCGGCRGNAGLSWAVMLALGGRGYRLETDMVVWGLQVNFPASPHLQVQEPCCVRLACGLCFAPFQGYVGLWVLISLCNLPGRICVEHVYLPGC